MIKIFKLFIIILIILFFFSVSKYYLSNKNMKIINLNRVEYENILEKKIKGLPILKNDTVNIIEYNNSISEKIKKDKKRNFWDLLK